MATDTKWDIFLSSIIIFFIIIMMVIFYYKFKPDVLPSIGTGTGASANYNPILGVIMLKRFQYISIFTIFLILAFIFYFWNPWGLASTYFGPSTVIILFVGIFLIGLMINYTLMYSTREQAKEQNTVWDLFIKASIVLTAVGASIGMLYWILIGASNLHSSSSIIAFIINLLLILAILGLVFKVLMASQFVQTSPFVRFIINFVLYIPCIFVTIIDTLVILFTRQKIGKLEIGNKTEFILLGIVVLLLVAYFTLPYLENYIALQGGSQLINQPIYINTEHDLANYLQLNGISQSKPSDKIIYDYQYGVSFWLYLDSVASGQDKYITVFNYGDKPRVMYKSSSNTLMITEKPNTNPNASTTTKIGTGTFAKNAATTLVADPTTLDENGNRIIYKQENMLLQKWNNIVMNYSGGTLDVFINGKLVKSEPNVVPYMTMDILSVGENNGVHGGICNLVYFKNTLSSSQIYYLYNSMKDKTPPSLYSSTESITNVLGH
jgi:hypothetical protein